VAVLRGRDRERAVLAGLLEQARGSRGAALVLHGDPGIGKTALLEDLVEAASGFRVVRAEGVESEMELPYAALHQLCGRMTDGIGRLPESQLSAVRGAIGLDGGGAADPFLVAVGVLTLLSDMASEKPLLCVIDDAQWLDRSSVQALGFVARRLGADPVAMIFAVREPVASLAGIPELVVEGLSVADARQLLSSVIPGQLDDQVRDRIIAETSGNPLALLEFGRGTRPGDLAGGFGLPDVVGSSAGPPSPGSALARRIEARFLTRITSLPADTRLLLLVAAAEPTGNPDLFWRAAQQLGIAVGAADVAEAAGLLRIRPRVAFGHPLMRSAVYRSASISDRLRIHAVLAQVTDPGADPDRRAWHRAQAALHPDEDVAAELERAAGVAQTRSGLAAAAAFLERAAVLSPDPPRRLDRFLAAAQASLEAGSPEAAQAVLTVVRDGTLSDAQRARLQLLSGRTAFFLGRGNAATGMLLEAARLYESIDVRLARDTYLDALEAATFAGRLAVAGDNLHRVAERARHAPPAPEPASGADLLLEALTARYTTGIGEAMRLFRRAVGAFRAAPEFRWFWPAIRAALDLWDADACAELAALQVRHARQLGALGVLPIALDMELAVRTLTGDTATAESLVDEERAIAAATQTPVPPYGPLFLAAWRGREAEVSAMTLSLVPDITIRGEGIALTFTEYATAVLNNGLGRYEVALAAAQRACEQDEQLFAHWALPELAEAAMRCGRPEIAADAVDRQGVLAAASGTDWAAGLQARSRALVSDGQAAEDFYQEAISRLGQTPMRADLARAHLVYGEWLRRNYRRGDARDQLRAAYRGFDAMDAEALSQRAARELHACGERPQKRAAGTADQLTPQESRIARLAVDGESNAAIAEQLFLSARTVEYHLHKVYTKLGITSRNKLSQVLGAPAVG
jgi:DNA-binding CsgD family transcriptional regulator/tetratricopeptide (TPR) repeat protein